MEKHTIDKNNSILKFLLIFISLIFFEYLFLILVSLIPKDAIHPNMLESANTLCEKDVFFYVNSNDRSSRIDRYADSILLNIAYNYEAKHPLSSVMSSSYYFNNNFNENINLQNAVIKNHAPTIDYSRYWHGSISVIRPLLVLFNIEQIYILLAIAITVLLIIFLILVYKNIGKGAVACFIAAAIMTSLWYVPMSLEYSWTILIMLIASIICTAKLKSKSYHFHLFFFITGNITAYFDFLTTETLTLLIPMILIILYTFNNNQINSFISEAKKYILYGVYWLIGYGLTWVAKWSLASIILKENVFAKALNQASYRLTGDADNLSGIAQCINAQARNITCLFPFSIIKANPLPIVILFTLIVICIIYLLHKEKCTMNLLLIIVAVIPYIRYLILSNHSYMHYFFTFRAQFATILCLGIIMVYGTDKALIAKEQKKLSKKWSCLWKKRLKKR